MNTFVSSNQDLVHDSVFYWQPMQFAKYRGNVFRRTRSCDKPSSRSPDKQTNPQTNKQTENCVSLY